MNAIVPPGCKLLEQSQVTADMTAWAVALLGDVAHYPMFAFAVKTFGTAQILGHIEWHPPDANNGSVHRGVTLYAIPAAGAAPEGIDVSGFQPVVNWPQVASGSGGGKVFAFIKATEGTALVDSQFAQHWAGAKSVGILRGAYHFLRPEMDAVAQAKHFLAQLAADPGELPPVVDVEVSDNLPVAQVAACVSSWMDYVNKNFGRSIIYTMPGFWDTLPTQNLQLQDLWVAHWGVAAPTVPRGWPSWQFWQYTDKATVSGIPGSADMDDDRFNGSYFDLLAYSAGSLRPAPLPAQPLDLTTVVGVQQALITLGYDLGPTGADGDPGSLTRGALESFQLSHAVDFLDACGPLTQAALQAALAAKGAS